MPSVEWAHTGSRLIVPIAVFPDVNASNPFDVVRTTGLIDTGATRTALRGDVANRLGLTIQGRRRVETVNGPVWSDEFIVRLGIIAGNFRDPTFEADSVLPYVLEQHLIAFNLQPSFAYPVLIGMDVISQCDLHVLRDGTARIDLP